MLQNDPRAKIWVVIKYLSIKIARESGYLLTLRSMKHYQAVTLATLGWRSQLPQFVCLSRLGHLGVSEGAWRAGGFD